MDFLHKHIEALIFCSPVTIKTGDIQNCLTEMFETEVPERDIEEAITKLTEKYARDEFSFELSHVGGGFQFMTKPSYKVSIGILLKQQSKRRLSTSALETLSIIAYKQPVTKAEIEAVRGVNCDYTIQKLLEKELVVIKGKSKSIGRPLIYATSNKFMEYFGINNLNELPAPKEFTPPEEATKEKSEG